MDASRICSNRPRQEGLSLSRSPDIKGPTYSYWLNTTTEPDENRAALMLGRGNFRVATSRGHLTDMVDLSPGSSLLVVLDHGARAIPVLGASQAWPPAEAWPPKSRDALQVTQTRLIYRMPTDNPEYQLVLISRAPACMSRLSGGGCCRPAWRWAYASGFWCFCWCASASHWMPSCTGRFAGASCRCCINRSSTSTAATVSGPKRCCAGGRPDGTLTSPDLFIPMAENTGQIRQMTDFVLQRLLEQLGQLLRANPQLYISVNLAACDVMVPRIGQVMARLLDPAPCRRAADCL